MYIVRVTSPPDPIRYLREAQGSHHGANEGEFALCALYPSRKWFAFYLQLSLTASLGDDDARLHDSSKFPIVLGRSGHAIARLTAADSMHLPVGIWGRVQIPTILYRSSPVLRPLSALTNMAANTSAIDSTMWSNLETPFFWPGHVSVINLWIVCLTMWCVNVCTT